jgi:hypothetical protein
MSKLLVTYQLSELCIYSSNLFSVPGVKLCPVLWDACFKHSKLYYQNKKYKNQILSCLKQFLLIYLNLDLSIKVIQNVYITGRGFDL